MREIELKARLDHPQAAEEGLLRCADLSFSCLKTDQYWTIGDKTIRIRQETVDGSTRVFVTQKIKTLNGSLENNQELEFELPAAAVPVFTAILQNTGFILTAQKQKQTKVFIPHQELFTRDSLQGVQKISAEISCIEPLGSFLEIEILYPGNPPLPDTPDPQLVRAQDIIGRLLAVLNIPQSAVEMRPYNELLAAAGAFEAVHGKPDCPAQSGAAVIL